MQAGQLSRLHPPQPSLPTAAAPGLGAATQPPLQVSAAGANADTQLLDSESSSDSGLHGEVLATLGALLTGARAAAGTQPPRDQEQRVHTTQQSNAATGTTAGELQGILKTVSDLEHGERVLQTSTEYAGCTAHLLTAAGFIQQYVVQIRQM